MDNVIALDVGGMGMRPPSWAWTARCLRGLPSLGRRLRRLRCRCRRLREGRRFGGLRAEAVRGEAVGALADALPTGVTLLDPRTGVGGGLAGAGEMLLTPLRAAVEERITFQARPHIVRAASWDTGGCLGAGLLARDLLSAEVTA